MIRNEDDIEQLLKESKHDIINRVGKFMKQIDNREIQITKNKEKKRQKTNYNDSEGEENDRPIRPIGALDNIINKIEKEGLSEKQISELVDKGMAAYGDVIGETNYTSPGYISEQINIVPIVNVFANAYIRLPDKISNIKSCINI